MRPMTSRFPSRLRSLASLVREWRLPACGKSALMLGHATRLSMLTRPSISTGRATLPGLCGSSSWPRRIMRPMTSRLSSRLRSLESPVREWRLPSCGKSALMRGQARIQRLLTDYLRQMTGVRATGDPLVRSGPARLIGWRAALPLVPLLVLLAACGPRATPRALAERPPSESPEVPVVFVPGVTGVVLRDPKTGEAAWGTGRNLVRPHDDGYGLALPLVHEDSGLPVLEPVTPIEQLSLFGIHKPIYGPIRELLTGAGYVQGDLKAPRPGETLFFFAYDWRRDLIESAGLLRRQLEELRRVQGRDWLEVDLICQSSGAHLCRYLAKYGAVPLAEAEAGQGGLPPTLAVRRLILVGSSNGGSLRILREIARGRRYVPLIGRWMRPEVTFTFPSLFQDLPIYRRDLFLDAKGQPLDVDLFDPESWRRYGWSVYGKEMARRLRASGYPRFLGDAADRDVYLRRMLSEARRFQELLRADAPHFGETRTYVIGSADQPTPDRAVLLREGGGWRTLFTGDRDLRRRPVLHALATASGDEHATLASQDWLSPQEQAALALPPRRVRGGHFEALLTAEVKTFLLEALGRTSSYGALNTSPPFITNTTRSNAPVSFSGSPSTAITSAYLPGSMVPMSFSMRSSSAPRTVAVRIASRGDMP